MFRKGLALVMIAALVSLAGCVVHPANFGPRGYHGPRNHGGAVVRPYRPGPGRWHGGGGYYR